MTREMVATVSRSAMEAGLTAQARVPAARSFAAFFLDQQ